MKCNFQIFLFVFLHSVTDRLGLKKIKEEEEEEDRGLVKTDLFRGCLSNANTVS